MAQHMLRGRGSERPIGVQKTARATREHVRLEDFTDCLLQAYDGVARRAYQKFVSRGSKPGGELDDWLQAEQELGTDLKVDLAESKQFVHAMLNIGGVNSSEIRVAIEGRWLMVLGSQQLPEKDAPLAELCGMEWNSASGTAVAIRAGIDHDLRQACAAASGECKARDKDCDDAETLRMRWGSQPFCVAALPTEVDATRSVAVVASGVLAIRMTKLES